MEKHLKLSCIFLFLICVCVKAQVQEDSKLYWPEKLWVLSHPFVAIKAKKVTNEVVEIVNDQFPNGDFMGGKEDAYKHVMWMACLTIQIGERRSLKLGKAHERSNYIQFKRGVKKGVNRVGLPDSLSSVMDLHNNKVGCRMAKAYLVENERPKKGPPMLKSINSFLQTAIKDADVLIVSKKGEKRLSCKGVTIAKVELEDDSWVLPGCLVSLNN